MGSVTEIQKARNQSKPMPTLSLNLLSGLTQVFFFFLLYFVLFIGFILTDLKNQSNLIYYVTNHTLLGSLKVRPCKNKVIGACGGLVHVDSCVMVSV